jgi:hypothetical protein
VLHGVVVEAAALAGAINHNSSMSWWIIPVTVFPPKKRNVIAFYHRSGQQKRLSSGCPFYRPFLVWA